MKTIVLIFFGLLSMALTAQEENAAPDPVSWNFELTQTDAGHKVTLTVSIDEGWHIYGLKLENDLGPLPTVISFEEDQLEWQELIVPKPMEKYDDMFMMKVSYYEKQVTFSRSFTGKFNKITGFVEFMVCNDSMCLPPTVVDFELAQ